jgi:bacillithiol system protein YtxJ
MALYRLEEFKSEKLNEYYYLDLIRYRNVSNEISSKFKLEHQSPQVLLIRNGKLIYHVSHNAIKPKEWGVYLD